MSLVDWLRQYAQTEEEREEVHIRGFLGKMIFSGEEALKQSNVLSGGEKVRCMLSKMMMSRSNVLLTTHDHAFAQTVGNRIIELTPNGVIDRYLTFDEYMTDPKIKF